MNTTSACTRPCAARLRRPAPCLPKSRPPGRGTRPPDESCSPSPPTAVRRRPAWTSPSRPTRRFSTTTPRGAPEQRGRPAGAKPAGPVDPDANPAGRVGPGPHRRSGEKSTPDQQRVLKQKIDQDWQAAQSAGGQAAVPLRRPVRRRRRPARRPHPPGPPAAGRPMDGRPRPPPRPRRRAAPALPPRQADSPETAAAALYARARLLTRHGLLADAVETYRELAHDFPAVRVPDGRTGADSSTTWPSIALRRLPRRSPGEPPRRQGQGGRDRRKPQLRRNRRTCHAIPPTASHRLPAAGCASTSTPRPTTSRSPARTAAASRGRPRCRSRPTSSARSPPSGEASAPSTRPPTTSW